MVAHRAEIPVRVKFVTYSGTMQEPCLRCCRDFDLSKQVHYLLRLVPVTSCHLARLVPVCLLVTGTN
jgi:hypothetical protein